MILRTSLAILVTLLLLTAAPAGAQPSEGTHPAIGRLNHAGFRTRMHCTVSLVGPREAVTAAHCIDGLAPGSLHVLLGYDRGDFAEHLRVRAVRAADADMARLCLEGAALAASLPTGEAGPQARAPPQRVTVIGYPRSRAHQQRRQDCTVLSSGRTYAWLGCAVEPGMSGAPVLADGQVVGVMSATAADTSLVVLLSALPLEECDGAETSVKPISP
jgi:protease YdgD